MGRYDSMITGGKKYAMNHEKMTNCHCDPERSEGEAISANVGTDLQVCPLRTGLKTCPYMLFP
jgi:hypothetical protein